MNASIQGALNQINKSYRAFTHKNKQLTKEEVRKILMYGLKRGYKNTSEFTDEEVDSVLNDCSVP